MNLVNKNLIFSKQRAFLVSETRDKVSGDYIGSYFPLAGDGSSPADVRGYYWSSTAHNTNYAYDLNVTPASSSVPYNYKTLQYSVRCVRTVTAAEFTSAATR